MTTTHPSDLLQLDAAFQITGDLCRDESSLNQVLMNKACTLIKDYLQFLRSGHGLSAFWLTYLDMVEILLALIGHHLRGAGTFIWHSFEHWFLGALHMTDWLMHNTCPTAMLRCHSSCNTSRGVQWIHAWLVVCPAWPNKPLWKNTRWSSHWKKW